MTDIPDDLEDAQIAELGGAVGRKASLQCRLGQHDLCGPTPVTDVERAQACNCR
jgi:hypothetical protein